MIIFLLKDEAEKETHQRIRGKLHEPRTGTEEFNQRWRGIVLDKVIHQWTGEIGPDETLNMRELQSMNYNPFVEGRM